MLRSNPTLLRGVAEAFLKDHPGQLAELWDAVKSASAPEIEGIAHRLRGSFVVLGAHRSIEGARRLEACAREGRLQDVAALCASLEREVRRLVDSLAELSELRSSDP
ncbi:MAG: Hpt domain-containing protein [Deltaproteobacteria bacterium]|nr:Hpt domain-containing protein [Deltaproteobacteria bacterium]